MSHSTEKYAPRCRHCGLTITRHEGIGGVQWRDSSPHSPSICFKAWSLVHDPVDPLCNERGVPESECPAHCAHGCDIPPAKSGGDDR